MDSVEQGHKTGQCTFSLEIENAEQYFSVWVLKILQNS